METLHKIKKYVKKHKYYFLAGACAIGGALIYYKMPNPSDLIMTDTSTFIHGAELGKVSDVVIEGSVVTFTLKDKTYITNLDGISRDLVISLLAKSKNTSFNLLPESSLYQNIMIGVMYAASISLGLYLTKDAFMPKKSVSTNKKPQKSIYFSDIYGHLEVKQKLSEIIQFIHRPQKYEAVGARMRRGILLYGPPGTGKTMIAKAAACEAGIDFIATSATEFVELYVGMGPKRVRELFEEAKKKPKGCIIFIDEFDAIGNRCQSPLLQDSQRNSTINQLLVEMDGFNSSTKIIVIGATNRESMIDPALLRPGRLDVKIMINLPNQEQRLGILQIHLRNKKHCLTDAELLGLAARTQNNSGADLQQIINESAYICLRKQESTIRSEHLEAAYHEMVRRA